MATKRKPDEEQQEVPRSRGARRKPAPVRDSRQIPELQRLTPTPIKEEERKALNLYQKRARIVDEVGIVPKRGWNDFHKYWYTLEADLDAYLGPLFAKYNVIIDVSVAFEGVQRIDQGRTSSGALNVLTRLPMKISLVNADKPEERFDTLWVGEGSDTGDKGVYKAYTGGMKFFYMKHFMIATGDDPEQFADLDRSVAEGGGKAPAVERVTEVPMGRGGYQDGPSEVQIRQLKAYSNALRLDPMQVLGAIDGILGTTLASEVSPDLEGEELNREVSRLIRVSLNGEQVGTVLVAFTERVGNADKAE